MGFHWAEEWGIFLVSHVLDNGLLMTACNYGDLNLKLCILWTSVNWNLKNSTVLLLIHVTLLSGHTIKSEKINQLINNF